MLKVVIEHHLIVRKNWKKKVFCAWRIIKKVLQKRRTELTLLSFYNR